MKCRAHATIKAAQYDYNVTNSLSIPKHCLIPQGTRTVKVPILKTSFISKEDYKKLDKSGIYAEMHTSDIEWLYNFVRDSVFRDGKPIHKHYPQNLDVLVLKSSKSNASAQIQINRCHKNFIQLDYYERSTTKPELIILCDTSEELPTPCKIISPNKSASEFAKKLCTIYCAAEKYCSINESRFCSILRLPNEVLSYWTA